VANVTPNVTPVTFTVRKIDYGSWNISARTRGWSLMEKGKYTKYSWYSVQGPGRMAQTPQAGKGDSESRFRRYHCSTVINYDSYFLAGEQFCFQLLFTT